MSDTIAQQLGRPCMLLLGAHTLIDHGDGLSFKFRGSKKANYVKIKLDVGRDTYDVTFSKIGRSPAFDAKVVDESSDVYVDQLHGLIESVTGLYTRF